MNRSSVAPPPSPKRRRKDLDISDDDGASTEDEDDVASDIDDTDEEFVDDVAPPPLQEKDIEGAKHMANYAKELERFQEKRPASVPDHRAFELAWALFYGFVAYWDVPPHFIRSRDN